MLFVVQDIRSLLNLQRNKRINIKGNIKMGYKLKDYKDSKNRSYPDCYVTLSFINVDIKRLTGTAVFTLWESKSFYDFKKTQNMSNCSNSEFYLRELPVVIKGAKFAEYFNETREMLAGNSIRGLIYQYCNENLKQDKTHAFYQAIDVDENI
jgi:hypothetical protein